MSPKRSIHAWLRLSALVGAVVGALAVSHPAAGTYAVSTSAGPQAVSSGTFSVPPGPVARIVPCAGRPTASLVVVSWSPARDLSVRRPIGAYAVYRRVGRGPMRLLGIAPTAAMSLFSPVERFDVVERSVAVGSTRSIALTAQLAPGGCPRPGATRPGTVLTATEAMSVVSISYRIQARQRADGSGFASALSAPVEAVMPLETVGQCRRTMAVPVTPPGGRSGSPSFGAVCARLR